MNNYPNMIKDAGESHSPAIIANYTYELVKEFNNFYQTVSILKELDHQKIAFRLSLTEQIASIIKSAMSLLGINVPNQM
jgi:arginyl-tRNA synthetase